MTAALLIFGMSGFMVGFVAGAWWALFCNAEKRDMSRPIHHIDEPYRGCRIGYRHTKRGVRSCWKSSLEDHWVSCPAVTQTPDQAVSLAKQCIDAEYYVIVERGWEEVLKA